MMWPQLEHGYDVTRWFSAEASLILEMIFSPLSIPDLLSCSLVNKNWRNSMGSILRKHKKCYAHVDNPCIDFFELNDMMKRSNETMINGLDIQIIPDETCYCKVLDEEKLLKRLSVLIHWPFQYLHVGDYFEHKRGFCEVSMKVVQELFWASRGTLRELAIKFATSSPEFFNNPGSLQRWTTGGDNITKKKVYTFPMLKSVEFLRGYFPSNSYFYSFVVQSAPNLTEIKGEWANLGSVKFWNQRTIRLLKCIAIEPKQMVGRGEYVDCTDYDTLKKYSGIEPSLHGLRIRDDGDCEEVPFPSSWFDPLTQIFLSSRDTLTQLRCCSSELMKFIENEGRSNIDTTPCFPVLTNLHLAMPMPSYCCGKRADRSVLRRLRIGTNFPKLVELQVDLGGCQHQLEGEEYYERDSEECPVSGFSGALEIATWWPEPEPLDYFVKTFPLLTTLSIHSVFTLFDDDEHAYTLSTIFTSFQHLKTLKLAIRWGSHFHDDIPLFSLDAILCGINFEEAEQLRTDCQNNGLKLENIEVVPVRPGLTSAASLEELEIGTYVQPPSPIWLSKVTGVLAINRMPNIEVTLDGPYEVCEELSLKL